MERFEPISSPPQKRGALLLQRFFLAHQFRFLGGVIAPLNYAVEKCVEKFLEALIHLFNLCALLSGHELGGLGGLLFLLINPFEHFIRPIRRERKWLQEGGNFRVQGFFANVGL
ncbi:MAG: hypothetical protein WAO21_14505 [Verrucomicrobiia bacterium]